MQLIRDASYERCSDGGAQLPNKSTRLQDQVPQLERCALILFTGTDSFLLLPAKQFKPGALPFACGTSLSNSQVFESVIWSFLYSPLLLWIMGRLISESLVLCSFCSCLDHGPFGYLNPSYYCLSVLNHNSFSTVSFLSKSRVSSILCLSKDDCFDWELHSVKSPPHCAVPISDPIKCNVDFWDVWRVDQIGG